MGDYVKVTTSDEPPLKEAMKATTEEVMKWPAAIDEAFNSVDAKETWELSSASESTKLPTHVVLKIKQNADGSNDHFKARVVAGGNFEVYEKDYMETYAPVVLFTLVRVFLYIA